MSDNPFVVQVPEGATEIDLSPILRPLIHAIREEIRHHDSRAHSIIDRDKKADELPPGYISSWFYGAAEELRYQEQIRKVKHEAMVAYLEDTGWLEKHPGSFHWVRPEYFNKKPWEYEGPHVRLCAPQYLNLRLVNEVVQQMRYREGTSKLEMVNIILSYDNVLDRIAKELD